MGAAGSEFECKACSCSCDPFGSSHPRHGEVYGGSGLPPESPWRDEMLQYEAPTYNPSYQRKDPGPPPGPPTAPAGRTHGSRNREVFSESPDDSPKRRAIPPPLDSPRSPRNEDRQSWQDLDADGNYHLHFFVKRGDRFGLQLIETSDPAPMGLLVVAYVELSGTFAFTSKRSPGLFAGDMIMQVNRQQGSAASMRDVVNQVATNGGQLFLVVQSRPAAFDVCMKREGPNWKKLGLSVAIDKHDSIPRMRVRTIRTEGLIPQWNERHGSMRICAGDWITQVNGITKNAEQMYAMIQASREGQDLELRVETPSRDAPRQELEILSPRADAMAATRN